MNRRSFLTYATAVGTLGAASGCLESLAVVDASALESAGEQRGHWVHAHTEPRFVQVASHGEKTWSKSFKTEIIGHRTDGSLFVGTGDAVYRFDPDSSAI